MLCSQDKARNEARFDQLAAHKDEIEREFGGPLEWERSEERKQCTIKKSSSTDGYRDEEEQWPQIQDETVDGMIRLERAFKRYIAKLKG